MMNNVIIMRIISVVCQLFLSSRLAAWSKVTWSFPSDAVLKIDNLSPG